MDRLLSLSEREQEYISTFQRANSISVLMKINDGIVSSLETKRLIKRSSPISSGGLNFPFNIHPKVWEYIKEHPEYLIPAIRRTELREASRSLF